MLVCFRAVPLPLEDHRFQRDFRLSLPQLNKDRFHLQTSECSGPNMHVYKGRRQCESSVFRINSSEIPAGVCSKKTLKSPASAGKLVASLSYRNSTATSCSFASGQSSELPLRSSGALRAELDAPSGQQENSEIGSYEGVSETWQPFSGLPVALLF